MTPAEALTLPPHRLRAWLTSAFDDELVEAARLVRPHEGQALRMLEAELSRRLETA